MSEMVSKGHRCLYEILEIPRTASTSELRAAYKALAQKWHPDKNQNSTEEASQRFKEINEAYEMLSDENERKWYDAHREQLLSGNTKQPSNTNKHEEEEDEEEEEEFDIVPYLSPWAFSTFDQTKPNNFYQVYNAAFMKIAGLEGHETKQIPRFGHSASSYLFVQKFYDFWEGFGSIRDFDVKGDSNADVNHLKSLARNEWEQNVIRLVAFVKRRDPRLRKYAHEMAAKALQANNMNNLQKEQPTKSLQQIRDEQMLQRQKEKAELERDFERKENERVLSEQDFECMVCGKHLKTEAALRNHEKSKKHIKLLQLLEQRLNMEEDEEEEEEGGKGKGGKERGDEEDVQLGQMRSAQNNGSNKHSGEAKEHALIKHVIRGGGSSLALKEAVHTVNSTQNRGGGSDTGIKTESKNSVNTMSKTHSANDNDNDNNNNDDEADERDDNPIDVDSGPKQPQKVEDVVAFVNQLNMDELLAQQLAGENLPVPDAPSLPSEVADASIDKDPTVMESAANTNDNTETEQAHTQDKDVSEMDMDLILAMQLEIEETNQMLNTMTDEAGFNYGDEDNDNETLSTTQNTNGKPSSGKTQKPKPKPKQKQTQTQKTNGDKMTEKDMDYLLTDIGERELHEILEQNHITIDQLLDGTGCIDPQKIKQYQRKLKKSNKQKRRRDNDTPSSATDKNQTEAQNKSPQPKADPIEDILNRFQQPPKRYNSNSNNNKQDDDIQEKAKRRKRRQKDQRKAKHEAQQIQNEIDFRRCKACYAKFDSKHQLLAHLKEHPGHNFVQDSHDDTVETTAF